ncbi:hypothetical protein FRC04_007373 [Tulasnella sp. 424]|nr:hypothetical protein FRC04_007373 [Tulasnella sp. 424]KAG8971604.1 hypothetical protein FRC05_010950 [Tulasnella sp. 425]
MPPKRKRASTPDSFDSYADQEDDLGLVKKKGKLSSSYAHAEPSVPASKPEKRQARIRNSCPQNIMDRVDRVMSQRFFMIDRQRNDDDLREVFKVLGSTGNVYTVVIDKVPSCDCPDAGKGNHCKHILFVFFKVLNVSVDTKYWYQKALISSELQEVFDNAPPNPAHVASQQVKEAYGDITGTSSSQGPSKSTQPPEGRRIFEEDDKCAVCCETLKDVPDSDLVWCGICKNALNKECYSNYRRSKIGKPVTCPWCRNEMEDLTPSGKGKGKATISEDGYLNLASAAGVSRTRDTSTYYDGPSRRWSNYREWI